MAIKTKKAGWISWGFDLTNFKSDKDFKALLSRNKLSNYKKVKAEYGTNTYHFVWSNSNLVLTTANNPITGEFNTVNQRAPEKGYASYIGIDGREADVLKLVEDIKKTANDIKDESPNERQYI